MFGLDGAREAKGSLEMARGTVSARTTTAKLFQTSSYPPAVAATKAVEVKGNYEKMASAVGKESFKKRKAEKLQNSKVVTEESKRIKACEDEGEESKITGPNTNKSSNNKKEASGDASKENSKVSEVRREKISERMKYLQDLVPGCNKITGKAGMLDEIINYVQSLQRKVEADQLDTRLRAVRLVGSLFALPSANICEAFQPIFSEFLKRLTDRVVDVRIFVLEHVKIPLDLRLLK
ncbi:hypothetical protein GOBAR_DD31384 [Gossypium barbadense]|nr:hypothetical protein GOBAR_DD31384 [Gossypium barbadense]